MRTVFFDLETGGLLASHPNIQLAAIAVENGRELGTFEAKIAFDPATADPEALEVNCYTTEAWAGASEERVVLREFVEFLQAHASVEKTSLKSGKPYRVARLAGHNVARYDMDRLFRAAKTHGIFLPADHHALDTLQGATWFFTANPPFPPSLKLSALCHHFGIEYDPNAKHDALRDTRATIQLARKLVAGWKLPK